MALLELERVTKRFGGLVATNDISFSVHESEIAFIVGPNGAGKTTLFNLISGVLRPDSGLITFDGKTVQGLRPHEIAAKGIARTFQHIRLFPKMTALENIMVGRHLHSTAGFISGMLNLPFTRREQMAVAAKSREVMEFLGIADLADAEATSLAYGRQRVVELGRALACEPKLLLLDEPAAGLNMRETVEISALIGRIRDLGITIFLVEHDMSLVMNISEEILVLSYGQKIADDEPLAVQKNSEVIKVYLGEDSAAN